MRTQKIAISALVASLTLGGLVLTGTGCAGNRYQRSTGAYLDDKGISAKVKTALFRDPDVSGFDVKVDTYRGDVQLSGFVDTQAQKDKAAQVAREVSGVRMVTNNLEIKPAATAVGTSGSAIQGSSATYSQPTPEHPAGDVNVNSNPPQQQNWAPVRSSTGEKLGPAPQTSTSDQPITNNRGVEPAPLTAPSSSSSSINSSLNSAAMPQDLKVDISNGRAIINGSVASEFEKQNIERRVRDIPGVQNVENHLDVRTPTNR